ncbi:MAG TPA: hypothetical protein VGJ93_15910 [Desulfuromonadaceae bacterium]|jgi:hypothetical protein
MNRNHITAKSLYRFIVLLAVIISSGCTQVAHRVDLLYSPLSTYRGGTGKLEIVDINAQRTSSTDPSIRWVLGQIKDSEGVAVAEVISGIPPYEVITDAFKQELSAAGYRVTFSKALDKSAAKGIIFTDISVQLDEMPLVGRLETSCAIVLKLEIWKSGGVVNRLEYRSKFSDTAIKERDLLPQTVFQQAIREVILKAVPDIITQLE